MPLLRVAFASGLSRTASAKKETAVALELLPLPDPPRSVALRRTGYDAWQWFRLFFWGSVISLAMVVIGVELLVNTPILGQAIGCGLAVFGTLFGGFCLLFLAGVITTAFWQFRLVRNGLCSVATLVERQAWSDGGFGGYTRIRYSFMTVDGRCIDHEEEAAPEPFWDAKEGDQFTVLYKRNRPSDHLPYASSMFVIRAVRPIPSVK